jgi:carboxymethylenebutenolidase
MFHLTKQIHTATRNRRLGMIGLMLVLAVFPLSAAPAAAKGVRKAFVDTLTVGGKKVLVDRFEPKGKGPHPAVILVHDSAGLQGYAKTAFTYCCNVLADKGYVVLMVHYFDGTSFKKVERADVNGDVFKKWMANVRAAVKHARARQNVDRKRIGLVGFSLGGYLALAVARQPDLKIAAVVEFFGGLPDELWKGLKWLPPTLILHGDRDNLVPAKEAYALWKFMEANKLSHEVKIYPGEKHLFKENLIGKAIKDAQLRSLAFFRRHLKHEVAGKVKAVDVARGTLTITVFDGTERAFRIDKGTRLIVCGKVSTKGFGDHRLARGTRVVISTGGAEGKTARGVQWGGRK